MKNQTPFTHRKSSKTAAKLRKPATFSAARQWETDDLDQQSGSGECLNISELYRLSRQGLWGLLIFLLVSALAFMVQDFNLYNALPEPILQILGCPPPAILIHLAITAYSFTVVVPVLIRMATGETPTVRWHHLVCRSVFYLFYLVSNSLSANFVAVVCIGVLLYTIEQVGIWSYKYKYLGGVGASN